MPMLGDLLASARESAGSFQQWLKLSDPEMADRVEAAAEAEHISSTGFVRMALADFARLASEEDWATLTSDLKRSDDPGTVCLLAMVDWRLTARACAHHSHDQTRLEGEPHGQPDPG